MSDSTILIPIHINGFHWVAIARKIIHNKVILLYADDLQSESIERTIKCKYSQANTSPEFHPNDTSWISCQSYKYLPHSNECGPRILLALSIMAMSTSLNEDMLIPYMHPNIGQISRWWTAKVLIPQTIDLSLFQRLNHTTFLPGSYQTSDPAHLAPLHEKGPDYPILQGWSHFGTTKSQYQHNDRTNSQCVATCSDNTSSYPDGFFKHATPDGSLLSHQTQELDYEEGEEINGVNSTDYIARQSCSFKHTTSSQSLITKWLAPRNRTQFTTLKSPPLPFGT